jgi:multidrug resistance efflux pump
MLEGIELAKIEVRDAQADLKEKEQKLTSQIEKLESYRKFGINKLQIAKAKIAALKEKYRLAEKRHKRTAKLHAVGAASGENLDKVAESVVSLRSQLEVAIVERQIAARAIEETYNGRFFTDHRLEGEVDELRSAVEAAKERVVLEEERLKVLEGRLQRLVVSSPVDGEIISLYPDVHQIIEKGDPLLLIERDGERKIEAFVSAQDLDSVMLDQSAKVIVRGRPHSLIARVTAIERTGVQEVGQTNIANSNDGVFPPVRVKLALIGNTERKSIDSLPTGFPVTVEFSKRSLSDNFPLLATIADFFLSVGVAVETQP